MNERDIGLEILEGIREIKAFKRGEVQLKTRVLAEPSPARNIREKLGLSQFAFANMADPVALRALVEAEKPQLMVPEIEAIATDELAAIEAAGLAEVIPTARAAQLTMNREGIRRLAAEELGLPTSHYHFASSLAEMQAASITGG